MGSTHGSRIEVKPFWPRTRRRLESEDVSTLSGPSSLLLRNHVESPMPSSLSLDLAVIWVLPLPASWLPSEVTMTLHSAIWRISSRYWTSALVALPIGEHHPCITKRPLLGGINRWMPWAPFSQTRRFPSAAPSRSPISDLASDGDRLPNHATISLDSRYPLETWRQIASASLPGPWTKCTESVLLNTGLVWRLGS